jgi:GNAT superfamily N-acetyltransferase
VALSALSRYRLRLSRGLERFGWWGLAKRAIFRVFSTNEVYVWYVLDLRRVVPIPFRKGYVLHRATADEVEWLHEVPAIPVDEGRRRIADGEQLWFVLKDDKPVFACSAFVHVLPLEAARKGRYEFPKGVGCVDDALTSPEHRGRAVAASAWMAIAERLRDEDGLEVLIAKVPEDNIPSRRTHEKTGFRPVSVMNRRRRGFKRRVIFRDDPPAPELTDPERAAAEHLKQTVSR